MLKSLFVFYFLVCLAFGSAAQPVPSNCDGPDSVKNRYREATVQLALGRIKSQGKIDTLGPSIPGEYTDTFLRVLMAVHNATSLPSRDSVCKHFYSGPLPKFQVYTVRLIAHRNTPWMQEMLNGDSITSNDSLNSIMNFYRLRYYDYLTDFSGDSIDALILKTDSIYFMSSVGLELKNLSGVINSYPPFIWEMCTEDFQYSIHPGYIDMTYVYSWDWSGRSMCREHYWKFRVYDDCSVEFLESYGEIITDIKIPPTGITLNHPTISFTGLDSSVTLTAQILPVYSGQNQVAWHNSAFDVVSFTGDKVRPLKFGVSILTATSQAGHTARCTVTVAPPAGLDPPSGQPLISPNPFSDHLDVSGISTGFNYTIYTTDGRKLLHGTTFTGTIEELAGLNPAYYLLLITNESGIWKSWVLKD